MGTGRGGRNCLQNSTVALMVAVSQPQWFLWDPQKFLLHLLDDGCNLKTMRYPAEQKAETHEKILTAAARSFREHGSEANGIARLMKELGLTHGGFYRH